MNTVQGKNYFFSEVIHRLDGGKYLSKTSDLAVTGVGATKLFKINIWEMGDGSYNSHVTHVPILPTSRRISALNENYLRKFKVGFQILNHLWSLNI